MDEMDDLTDEEIGWEDLADPGEPVFGYSTGCLFCTFLLLALYYRFCFENVRNPFTGVAADRGDSMAFLVILTMSLSLIGYLLTRRRGRSGFEAVVSALIPLEVYALLSGGKWPGWMVPVSLTLFFLPACFFAWASLYAGTRDGKASFRFSGRRLAFFLARVRIAAALAMACFLVAAVGNGVFDLNARASAQSAAVNTGGYAGNSGTLIQFTDERWKPMTPEARQEALQKLVNMEAGDWGTPMTPTVRVKELDEDEEGRFNTFNGYLVVSREQLEDGTAEENLNTVLHEFYHYYQLCAEDALSTVAPEYRSLALFSDARESAENRLHYVSGTDGFSFSEYYSQPIEAQARRFAANETGSCLYWARYYAEKAQ